MGRKQRKNRRKNEEDEDEADHSDKKQEVEPSSPTKDFKDLDFAERRELQRKQAADKRRAKMKCYLCGKAGHVRRECPGVQDDGRGMSRYKGKSNAKHEKEKYYAKKHSSGASGSSSRALAYPLDKGQDFWYYDVSCDVQATLEYCRQGRGKHKISQKEAVLEYSQALAEANDCTNFGGMVSKSVLKPNRPWIPPESPLPEKTWYTVGLARDFLYNDSEEEASIQALVDTLSNNPKVIGYWAVLDYTPEYCKRPGCDRESQLRRVQATCQAAAQTQTTLQLQVLPGAGGLTIGSSVAGTDYAKALLDLQVVLTKATTEHASLKVVLTDWAGFSEHMLSFLKAFEGLYMGLDGAVGFGKAAHLHECAFEVPLERLVLETATIIPSEIANALGREAFFHSGLWLFVAQAVAHYKKTVSVEEVARATSEVTLKLYPQLAAAVVQPKSGQEDAECGHEEKNGNDGKDDQEEGKQ